MPRAFSTDAMPRQVRTPLRWISAMAGRMAVARPDTRRCCSIRPTTPAAAGAGPPSRRPRAFAAASAALVRAEIISRSCSATAART
jgi:hypothetical protein